MRNLVIFLSEFALSLIAFGLLARFVWWDYLRNQPSGKADALVIITQIMTFMRLARD